MALGDLHPATWRIDVYAMKPVAPYAGVITDLSNLYTSDLQIVKQRNYPDEIRFTLDLQQLEERAIALSTRSRDILEPYKHKVMCYRNGKFIAQGIVVKTSTNLNNDAKNTVEVSCVDVLGLLEKRLIHQDYGEGSWADFAKQVISDAQHEPNRIYNYAWEGDGTSIDNVWFRGWKYLPGEAALRDFPEWEPNKLYSMYDTCTHDGKFWEAKERAFYSGETFSESNWTLLGILDSETGEVDAAYGVWREDDEELGPTGTALGGWGGTSSCHMTANSFAVNNGGGVESISMANSTVSTSLTAPFESNINIPEEFTQVEYLEGVGTITQWINLGFVPTATTCVEAKFMTTSNDTGIIIGRATDTTNFNIQSYASSGASSKMRVNVGSASAMGVANTFPTYKTLTIRFGKCYKDSVDEVFAFNVETGTWLAYTTATSFSAQDSIRAYLTNVSTRRFYYVKIYDGYGDQTLTGDVFPNQLKHYFVPCVRKIDGSAGFYDFIAKNFVAIEGNTSTAKDNFVVGEETAFGRKANPKYTEMAYLQNTIVGGTNVASHINIGINPRRYGSRLKFTIRFNLPDASVGSGIPRSLLGSDTTAGTWTPRFDLFISSANSLSFTYPTSNTVGSSQGTVVGPTLASGDHTVVVDAIGNTPTMTVDGIKYTGNVTLTDGTKYGPDATTYAFARRVINPNESYVNGGCGAPIKLYSLKVEDSQRVLRDLIPVRYVNSPYTVGLYDQQNGTFYTKNSGSPDFTAGPDIEPTEGLAEKRIHSHVMVKDVNAGYIIKDFDITNSVFFKSLDKDKFIKKVLEEVELVNTDFVENVTGTEVNGVITVSLTTHRAETFTIASGTVADDDFANTLADWGIELIRPVAYLKYSEDGGTTKKLMPIVKQADLNTMMHPTANQNALNWSTIIDGIGITNSMVCGVKLTCLCTSLPNQFLINCPLLTELDISQAPLTEIPQNFVRYCVNFNQAFTIPSTVTAIGNIFLYQCESFNQAIVVPNSVTTIGQYFLANCYGFNSALTLSNHLTTIGARFLQNAKVFNQTLTIPNTVTSIGTYFLYDCQRLTTPIQMGTVSATVAVSSDQSFSVTSTSVNAYTTGMIIECSTIALESEWKTKFPNRTSNPYRKLRTMGYGLLQWKDANNNAVNSYIQNDTEIATLASSSSDTWTGTVEGNSVANTAITRLDLKKNPTLPNYFLRGVTQLTYMRLRVSKLTAIPNYFAYKSTANLTDNNGTLTLPSTLTSIGTYFFASNSAFDISLVIPSGLTSIGTGFLQGASAYNQNVTLPSTVTTIGSSFMRQCNALDKTVNISALPNTATIGTYAFYGCRLSYTVDVGSVAATVASSSDYTFSTNANTYASYTTGVYLTGANASAWKTRFPDRTATPYRKINIRTS